MYFSFDISGSSNVGSLLVFDIGLAMCNFTNSNPGFGNEMSRALDQVSAFLLSIYQVSTS
jgi:hypothetical protein